MKRLFKRLFCFHLNWVEGRPLGQYPHCDDYVIALGKGEIVPWTCTNCGKVKQFTRNNPPLQYLDR